MRHMRNCIHSLLGKSALTVSAVAGLTGFAFGASEGFLSVPDETIGKIRGVDTLVLNCLRERQHPTHLSLERAKEYIAAVAPRKAYLIHMCHDFTHEEWLAKLAGTNIEPAYDGLEIEVKK